MIILKPLITGTSWLVFHQGLTSNDDLNAEFLRLNAGDGEVALPGSTSGMSQTIIFTHQMIIHTTLILQIQLELLLIVGKTLLA